MASGSVAAAGVCGRIPDELSSKTEGIGVPPALEKETGKGKNRILQVVLGEIFEKNLRKELRVSYETARTTEQNAPRKREAKKTTD